MMPEECRRQMKQKRINSMSAKRKKESPLYYSLVARLRTLCNNVSELSRGRPDWQSGYKVEGHHIFGRIGKLYLDPYNLILITRSEHDYIKKLDKEYLKALVKERRDKQGFRAGD